MKTQVNSMKRKREGKMSDRIKLHGSDILDSDEFKRAYEQVHHHKTSVGAHSVLTAEMGLKITDALKKRGIEVDERKVVRTALLHDIGMLGRKERYKNNFECGYMHPKNSADAAQKIWKDIDQECVKAIRSHMWPLSLNVPTTREAFVLCLADKMAAIKDATLKKKPKR